MAEFKVYHEAYSAYFANQNARRTPLLSWNFYVDYLSQLNKTLNDEQMLAVLASNNKWITSDFKTKFDNDTVIVVTCPKLKIVFASKNIVRMNGYEPEEIIGKSPKIFQGSKTNITISGEIREAIEKRQPFEKEVLNYRKDGIPYKCNIKGFPVFNKQGELTNFIAFEKAA
jgi:PAS domain S-box-containing protein